MVQRILKFLDDLGYQQFVESQVIQVKILDPLICFVSLVNGVSAYETKFFGDCSRHNGLYDIQVRRSINGVPSFSKLGGIVVADLSQKRL